MKTYKIGRVLHSSGWCPFTVNEIDGEFHNGGKFDTLRALKQAYGIKKTKIAGQGWAINSRGTKKTWNEYEGTN